RTVLVFLLYKKYRQYREARKLADGGRGFSPGVDGILRSIVEDDGSSDSGRHIVRNILLAVGLGSLLALSGCIGEEGSGSLGVIFGVLGLVIGVGKASFASRGLGDDQSRASAAGEEKPADLPPLDYDEIILGDWTEERIIERLQDLYEIYQGEDKEGLAKEGIHNFKRYIIKYYTTLAHTATRRLEELLGDKSARKLIKKYHGELALDYFFDQAGIDVDVGETPTFTDTDSWEKIKEVEVADLVVQRRAAIERVFKELWPSLTYREREIVKMYRGIDDYNPHTSKEIAPKFKISSRRVRQILKKAYRKLKHAIRSRFILEWRGTDWLLDTLNFESDKVSTPGHEVTTSGFPLTPHQDEVLKEAQRQLFDERDERLDERLMESYKIGPDNETYSRLDPGGELASLRTIKRGPPSTGADIYVIPDEILRKRLESIDPREAQVIMDTLV
ncbi:unnamed protein product, partial [marine sediment metagenome]